MEHHTDKLQAVALGAGHQGASGGVGVSGFAAHQVLVGILSPREQLHLVVLNLRLGQPVRGGKLKAGRHRDLAQHFIGKKSSSYHGHVIGGGVVVLIRQAVGVGKMGVHTSQGCRPLVHYVGEDLPVGGAGDMFRHSVGNLVGGADQQRFHTLAHGQGLSRVHGDMGAVPGSVEDGLLGKVHNLVHLAHFRGDQGSENLGGAGGVLGLMDIFGVEDGAGLGLYQNGRLGPHHRARGPVGGFIGLNRHGPVGFQAQFHFREGQSPGRGQKGQTESAGPGGEKPQHRDGNGVSMF